jgi:heterodisulfide reductase subunit A
VFTALQIEHVVNASGPTNWQVVLKSGEKPKAAGIIRLVGSRDRNTHEDCSRVCCMYSLTPAQAIGHISGVCRAELT